MAKCNLNGVTLDEVKRNATNAFAAGIESGEIFAVEGCHSKNGNPMLKITGRNLRLKGFDGSTFVADGCILYNPPLIKGIIDLCDDSNDSLFIVKGAVTKTAPASKPSSDIVQSKAELEKELTEIKGKFFSLTEAEQKAAKSRMDEIEKALKTA
jgi:hypothetical protein